MRRLTPEEKRENTRQRVARHRERHCVELAVKIELQSWMGPGRGARPTWQVIEFVSEDGLPRWVGAVKADAGAPLIPGTHESGEWVPAGRLLSRECATALAALRRQQIAAWLGVPDCVSRDGHVDWSDLSDSAGV